MRRLTVSQAWGQHTHLPAVFVIPIDGLDDEALSLVQAVGEVLVRARLKVLRPLCGVGGGSCGHRERQGQ